MQDAAGNIFVDRNGIWIRRHSHHSVINILVGIFVVFQVVFRPAAYCGCCNSTCGMYLSLTLQHGIIGIDIHEVYFNNSNTWSASPYPRARGTPID